MYRGQHSQLQLRGPTPIQELSQCLWKIGQLDCCLFKIKNHSWNFSFELKLCKWVVWIPRHNTCLRKNKFNNLTDKNEIQNCLPGKDLVFCWSLQWEEPWHLGGIPHTVKLPVKRQKGPDMLYRKCHTVYDDQHFRFGPDCLSACGVG